MKLIVWNSQGAKWDTFWRNPITAATGSGEDILGLLVEAGWAPWIQSGDVSKNRIYPFDTTQTIFNPKSLGTKGNPFCNGVEERRQNKAYWVPWVKNPNGTNTNSRCSMGGVIVPARLIMQCDSFATEWMMRPIIRTTLNRGRNAVFTIMLVHLTSGAPKSAKAEVGGLIAAMLNIIPEGTAAAIVGDMNIDLLKYPPASLNLPPNWRILNIGMETQQSGGELDYAFLYDPNGTLSKASATDLQKYKSGYNQSDHSVLAYDIPLGNTLGKGN